MIELSKLTNSSCAGPDCEIEQAGPYGTEPLGALQNDAYASQPAPASAERRPRRSRVVRLPTLHGRGRGRQMIAGPQVGQSAVLHHCRGGDDHKGAACEDDVPRLSGHLCLQRVWRRVAGHLA